jgi:carbamoyltransferase
MIELLIITCSNIGGVKVDNDLSTPISTLTYNDNMLELNTLMMENMWKVSSVYSESNINLIRVGRNIANNWSRELVFLNDINPVTDIDESLGRGGRCSTSTNLKSIIDENHNNATIVIIAQSLIASKIINLVSNMFVSSSRDFYQELKLPHLSISSIKVDKNDLSNSFVNVVGKPYKSFFKKTYELGLNFGTHDSSICISKNGKIVFAGEEERFNREKRTRKYPYFSLLYAQNKYGISDYMFKVVLMPNDPEQLNIEGIQLRQPNFESEDVEYQKKRKHQHVHLKKILENNGFLGTKNLQIKYYSHHKCHAASSYFLSGFQEAMILTLDGMGEKQTMGLYEAFDNKITLVSSKKFPDSIGKVYGAISGHLGYFGPSKEGKVMALSCVKKESVSKGTFFYFTNEIFPNVNTDLFDLSFSSGKRNQTTEIFHHRYGSARKLGDELQAHHLEIAHNIQLQLELTVKEIIKRIVEKKPDQINFCLSGGVFLNCKLNGFLTSEFSNLNFYISPIPHDGGLSLGALSLYVFNNLKVSDQIPFLGFEDDFENVPKLIIDKSISCKKVEEICKVGAKLINDLGIVGWYQGKAEFGPRALGNRSIIGNPKSIAIKQRINVILKEREPYRPFASAILEDKVGMVFSTDEPIPFMTKSVKVKEKWKDQIPAVIHYDSTSRIQTVSKFNNPLFHELIFEFYQLTQIPLVLNTSLNSRDEPIVNSISDALSLFKSTELQVLIIGKYLVYKKSLRNYINDLL